MHCETVSTIVKSPSERTFRYLSTVANLPDWATGFCRRLETVGGRHYVDTPDGRVLVAIASDEKTGVVDFLAGPEEGRMSRWPARVVELPGSESLVLFTCVHEPGLSDEAFRGQVESLKLEMQNVKAALE